MINLIKKIIVIVAILGGFCLPFLAFGAELYISGESEISPKSEFLATVYLDTTDPINALEGSLTWPKDLLEVKEIRLGNSLVNFWVDEPKVKDDSEIHFSGITPGGLLGDRGQIFSVVFTTKEIGRGGIDFQNIRGLINDGLGSSIKVKTTNFNVVVKAGGFAGPLAPEKDEQPPETFKPEIGQDPNLFGGKSFLVFNTLDKNSGLDHFEIKEVRYRLLSFWSKWDLADSPYLLKDQSLRSFIYIKAIDKLGNERIVAVNPQSSKKWYENIWLWVIIILGIIFLFRLKTKNEKIY